MCTPTPDTRRHPRRQPVKPCRHKKSAPAATTTHMAAPLGHTFINIHLSHNSRLYCANLRLRCTPRHIAGNIRIIHRLDHARIRHIHRMRFYQTGIIGWNKPSIHNRSLRLTSHKRRVTKRGGSRQHRGHPGRNQGRLPRQTAKRLRRIGDTRSNPKHSNKRLNKSFQGTLKQTQPKLFTHNTSLL